MATTFRPTIKQTTARLIEAAPKAIAKPKSLTTFSLLAYSGEKIWVDDLNASVIYDLDTLRSRDVLVHFSRDYDPPTESIFGLGRPITNGRSLSINGKITTPESSTFALAWAAKHEHWLASLRVDERKLTGWIGAGESAWINGREQVGPCAIATGYLRGVSLDPTQGHTAIKFNFK